MLFSKLEIDVMQINEIDESAALAAKYRLPGLVVHPSLFPMALIARNKVNGKYNLYCPIGWNKHSKGLDKFVDISIESLNADGYEVKLSNDLTPGELRNEVKSTYEFIVRHISPVAHIRLVFSTLTDGKIDEYMAALEDIPTPNAVRNDTVLKLQKNKANVSIHNETIEQIKRLKSCPIKISGNVDNLKTANNINASKLAVSLTQAKAIIREYNKYDETRKLLNS